MGDEVDRINQQRIERDNKELQKLIETHFEERKGRRAGEVETRAAKEKAKREQEEQDKKDREEEEARAKAEREESKAAAFVPDKTKYNRTDEQKANSWNSKISNLYLKMHSNIM